MGEFQDMLKAGIAARNKSIRAVAAELDCAYGTLFNAASGKIRPPMHLLVRWSKLFDQPEDQERFIKPLTGDELSASIEQAKALRPVAANKTEEKPAERLTKIQELQKSGVITQIEGRNLYINSAYWRKLDRLEKISIMREMTSLRSGGFIEIKDSRDESALADANGDGYNLEPNVHADIRGVDMKKWPNP